MRGKGIGTGREGGRNSKNRWGWNTDMLFITTKEQRCWTCHGSIKLQDIIYTMTSTSGHSLDPVVYHHSGSLSSLAADD